KFPFAGIGVVPNHIHLVGGCILARYRFDSAGIFHSAPEYIRSAFFVLPPTMESPGRRIVNIEMLRKIGRTAIEPNSFKGSAGLEDVSKQRFGSIISFSCVVIVTFVLAREYRPPRRVPAHWDRHQIALALHGIGVHIE